MSPAPETVEQALYSVFQGALIEPTPVGEESDPLVDI